MRRFGWLVLWLVASIGQALATTEISAVRTWRAPDNTRLVFDLSAPAQVRISDQSGPAQLVLEFSDARVVEGVAKLLPKDSPVRGLQLQPQGSGVRVVLSLNAEVTPKLFQLPPNEKYGHRLVLDLFDRVNPSAAVKVAESAPKPAEAGSQAPVVVSPPVLSSPVVASPPAPAANPVNAVVPVGDAVTAKALDKVTDKPSDKIADKPVAKPLDKSTDKSADKTSDKSVATEPLHGKDGGGDHRRGRNLIIAVDAGHGGEDSGAVGANGTHEKDVTLAIAKALRDQLNGRAGISAVLTREGDYFIPLVERRRIARDKHRADIFVSVHADAAPSRAARGASVFALSLKGANTASSRFARALADRENSADLIGGVPTDYKDDVLNSVLADMVVSGSLEHSLHMGRNVLGELSEIGRLHARQVEQAGFAVLKEPGVVSVLVETGFISNPEEEGLLKDESYQRKLARAIAGGVGRYLDQYPIPGTYFAWKAEREPLTLAKTEPVRADAGRKGREAKVEAESGKASAKPQDEPRMHRVASGENLTRIAAKYQVQLASLRELNRIDGDVVREGQLLKLP